MKRRPWWQIRKSFLAGNPESGLTTGEQANGPLFVDAHEMAQILQVPVSWIYRKTSLNQIPCVRIGKYIRFEPQKVVEHYQKTGVEGKAPS